MLIGLGVVTLVAIFAASLGTVRMPPLTVAQILLSKLPFINVNPDWPASWNTILWELRLPRIVLAGIVGGALATSGATRSEAHV